MHNNVQTSHDSLKQQMWNYTQGDEQPHERT